MAKVLRWRGGFADRHNISYTVEIYGDESEGSVVKEITLGDNPFVTGEDSSEDPQQRSRCQTGTLRIEDNDNGFIVTEILPETNTSRPVLLKRGNDIVWRGFLACDVYTIDYTKRVQVVEISLISVLEAMDSVEIVQNDVVYFADIYKHIAYCAKSFCDDIGMNMITDLYVDDKWSNGFMKYIYSSIFFNTEKVTNGNIVLIESHSDSIKVILEKMASAFGCNVRENNGSIYLSPNFGGSWRYNHVSYDGLINYLNGGELVRDFGDSNEIDMLSLTYIGDKHTLSISQGARRVGISAKLDNPKIEITIPSCPVTAYQEHEKTDQQGMYMLANLNDYVHQSIRFGWRYMANMVAGVRIDSIRQLTQQQFVTSFCAGLSWWRSDSNARKWWKEEQVHTSTLGMMAGAVLAKYIYNDGSDGDIHVVPDKLRSEDGLYLALWPRSYDMMTESLLSQVSPIVSLKSEHFTILPDGYINIQTDSIGLYDGYKTESTTYNTIMASNQIRGKIAVSLRVGNKYWDGNDWTSNSRAYFAIEYDDETEYGRLKNPGKFKGNWSEDMKIDETKGLLIPVHNMSGDVEISIWPMAYIFMGEGETLINYYGPFFELFMRTLDVNYIPKKDIHMGKGSTNEYTSYTGRSYKDTIQVDLDISTNNQNIPSSNMLYESNSTPVSFIQISSGTSKKPELEILDQMKIHYSKPRRCISLIVEPIDGVLPTTRVRNGDKLYIPISEYDRDWKQDISTLKLIETE